MKSLQIREGIRWGRQGVYAARVQIIDMARHVKAVCVNVGVANNNTTITSADNPGDVHCPSILLPHMLVTYFLPRLFILKNILPFVAICKLRPAITTTAGEVLL
jgi:hypothetical protein